jgi:hypothetical protein
MQEKVQVDITSLEPESHEGLAIVEIKGGCVKLAENGFSDVTGYDPDEVAELSLRKLFPEAGDILGPVEEGLKGWKGETVLSRKNGETLPVAVSIVPARGKDMSDVAFMMRINRIAY